jgi:DNA polymerase
MMNAMGFSRETNAYILNIVKCRPPSNRTPTPEESATCRIHLEAQLALIQPRIMVLLGATALKAFVGESARVTQLRGVWQYLGTRELWIMPTYHPAALLRNPHWKVDAWQDLKQVIDKYRALIDPMHDAPAHPLQAGD